MGDDGDALSTVVCGDKTNSCLDLLAGIFSSPKRRYALCRLVHFRVRVREPAKAMEIQSPDVKSGGAKLIALSEKCRLPQLLVGNQFLSGDFAPSAQGTEARNHKLSCMRHNR